MKKYFYLILLLTSLCFGQQQTGGVNVPTGFHLQDNQHLDDRENTVATIADLQNIHNKVDNLIVKVTETGKIYTYDEPTNTWSIIGGDVNHKGFTKRVNFEEGREVSIANVVSSINTGVGTRSTVLPFTVTSLDTPVAIFIYADNFIYKYLFYGGNGTWGLGGTPITTAMLSLFDIQQLTVDDVTNDPNTQTISLGNLPTGDYVAAANSVSRDLSNEDLVYYFSYTKDGILYLVQFIGTNGIYGGSGTQLVAGDFAGGTNSEVTPAQGLPSVLDNDNTSGGKDIIMTQESGVRFESGLSSLYARFNLTDNFTIQSSQNAFQWLYNGVSKNIGRSIDGEDFDVDGDFDLSGHLSGQFIPTTGTTEDNPVTGNLRFDNGSGTNVSISQPDDFGRIEVFDNSTSNLSSIVYGSDGFSRNFNGVATNVIFNNPTQNRLVRIQDKDGTVALLSDITGGGGGTTNLTYTASPTDGTVNSSTGTGATVPAATTTNAGLFLPAEKISLSNQSGTNSGDNATNTTSNTYADNKVRNNTTTGTGTTAIAPSIDAVNVELDKYVKALYNNNTPVTITGTSTETLIKTIAFPSGTFVPGYMEFNAVLKNTGVAGAKTIKMYITNSSTPNTTPGTTDFCASIALTAAGRYHRFQRIGNVNIVGTSTAVNFITRAFTNASDISINSAALGTAPVINPNATVYVHLTITLASSADDITLDGFQVFFNKNQ